MKKTLSITIQSILISSITFVACNALAYGHEKDLDTKTGEASLMYAAVKRSKIYFCVDVDSPAQQEFSQSSIEQQTQSAINLWLKPVKQQINRDVEVKVVDCSDSRVDLKVNVTPRRIFNYAHRQLLAMTDYIGGSKKPYVLVYFSTSFQFDQTGDTVHNFSDVVNHIKYQKMGLQQAMDDANSRKMQARDFGIIADVPDAAVSSSTYVTLIHEMGHAFGLCDTYAEDFDHSCDLNYVSTKLPANQASSIMKDSGYFYLTGDDVAGINSLADRYSQMKPNSQVASVAANHRAGAPAMSK